MVDIADWKRWAYPFMVIGANAITAYMLVHIIDFEALLKNLAFLKGGSEGVLMIAAALAFLLLWLFLWFLYKRKIFLRV